MIHIRLKNPQRRTFVEKDRLCPWLHLVLNLINDSNEPMEDTIIRFSDDTLRSK